jgi:DNA-binding response OmpR family regulator
MQPDRYNHHNRQLNADRKFCFERHTKGGASDKQSSHGGHLNPRILIVDDEKCILQMMELVLQNAGYETTTANSGKDALEKFGTGSSFDLVVLDFKMPDLNGIEVETEMLRRDPSTKVLIVSGFGGTATAMEVLNRGASDFLRKPFAPEALRDAVRNTLERDQKQSPLNAVCREFSRQGINGFSFELEKVEEDDQFGDITYFFEVQREGDNPRFVKVIVTAIAQELVKAYIDSDSVPCGKRFYEALAEETLANHLRKESSVPSSAQILVEDISPSHRAWIDKLMTISVA